MNFQYLHISGDTIGNLALLTPYLRGLTWRYLAGTLFLVITNAFALLIPWFMKLAVDGLQTPGSAQYSPAACALIITFLAATHCASRIASRVYILNAARLVEFQVREDLFRRLMMLDIGFYSTTRTGDIMSRFSNDLTNVRMLAGFGAMSSINTVIVYSAAVYMMAGINRGLTVWAILPFPAMVFIVRILSKRLYGRSLQAQESLSRLSSLAEESVSAVRVIKSFCREEIFREEFRKGATEYLNFNVRLAQIRALVTPIMITATGSGVLVTLFMGGGLVAAGRITLGDYVAFSGYLAMLVWPTALMGWIMTLLQRGAASMARLAAILTATPSVTSPEGAFPLEDITHSIEFRSASFHYSGTPAIRDISLFIAAGERIGITGPVGSGKTTLISLLPRLLPVADGMLFIDGIDINLIDLADLRRMIGYVPQEAFLFSRSIRDNVAFGMDASDDGRIGLGIRQAGLAADIAAFGNGIETTVGERGVLLSGGQKQRLSIARALAVNPRLLIFDDPLASVDAAHEDGILDELNEYCQGRTVIIVSQRHSAFRDCNRIVVLDEGRIIEETTPEGFQSPG